MTWSGAEGRSFALTALLAVLLTLVVAPAASGPLPGARWAGYAVLGGLAVAVDVYLALLLLAHAVTLARWGGRATLLRFLAAAGGALALAAPVVVVASRQTGQLGEQRLGPLGLLRAVLVNQVFLGDTPTPGTAPRTGLTLHGAGDLWQVCAILLAVAGLGLGLLGVRAARREPAARPGSSLGGPCRGRWSRRPWSWPRPWPVRPCTTRGTSPSGYPPSRSWWRWGSTCCGPIEPSRHRSPSSWSSPRCTSPSAGPPRRAEPTGRRWRRSRQRPGGG